VHSEKMRPPVQILKFLAIEGAENRYAEGVEGTRSPGRKLVLEYLKLEKTHLIVYQVCFLIYFVCIEIISVKL